MVFNQQSPGQSPTRKSDSCVGNSLVEEPSLVPNVNHHDSGLPSAPSQFSSDPDTITQLRLFSVTVTAATGRMENLRKYLKSKVIPEKALSLIASSWSKKTNDNYNSEISVPFHQMYLQF